jgi:RimJ/RimL family protein N-acetyltransferase
MILHKPEFEELTYRRDLLADPLTMSYNKGLNLGFSEYDNSTGCIVFPETTWKNWYNDWMNQEPLRYYAYLVVDNKFVGEVALRYVESESAHMINIVIDSRYRGKGYGKKGLLALFEVAFNDLNITKVIDEFPVSRLESKNLFTSLGFDQVIENDLLIFSITKEKYKSLGRFRM